MAINYLFFPLAMQDQAVKDSVAEQEARHFRLSLAIKQKVEEIKLETVQIEKDKLEVERLALVASRKAIARTRQALLDAYPGITFP